MRAQMQPDSTQITSQYQVDQERSLKQSATRRDLTISALHRHGDNKIMQSLPQCQQSNVFHFGMGQYDSIGLSFLAIILCAIVCIFKQQLLINICRQPKLNQDGYSLKAFFQKLGIVSAIKSGQNNHNNFNQFMDGQQNSKGEKQQVDAFGGLESLPIPVIQHSLKHSNYFQLFDSSRISQNSHSQHIEAELIKELKDTYEIKYDHEKFIEEMEFSISYQSINYEVIKLNVAYGRFATSFFIINVENNSPSNELSHIASGNFGNVFESYFRSRRYAIKSIPIKQNKFEQAFKSVLKELFILKIASALKIGPFSDNIYGFDLVIYGNCIEFSMQFCNKYNEKYAHNSSQLMNKLYLLHKCHILHNDIKPENICYSRFYEEYVLIDFGLSRIVKQTIGEKTMTAFVGSLQYCSPEMGSLFVDNSMNFIDLYHNDAFSLTKSIKVIQNIAKRGLQIDEQYPRFVFGSRKFNVFQQLIFFKSLLFKASLTSSANILKQIPCMRQLQAYRLKIRYFLLCIPYNELFGELYENYCGAKNEDDVFKMFSIKRNTQQIDSVPSLIVQRMNTLASHQSQDHLDHPKIHNSSLSPNQLNIDKQTLELIKLIKINGNTHHFQDKIQACKHYGRVRSLSVDIMQEQGFFYKAVIQSIFNQILESFDKAKADILKECIQTIIILEIVPQQRLKEAYQKVMGARLGFMQTVEVCFEFLMGLQFTKDRFKSTYDYDELTEVFLIELNSYLDESFSKKTLKQQELNILYRMKQVIIKKIDYVFQTFLNKSLLPAALDYHFNIFVKSEEERLLHSILTYLAYTETVRLLAQNNIVHNSNICYFKQEIIKMQPYSNHFIYLHLILFEQSYKRKEDNLNGLYNHLFQMQFLMFPEYKHFKVYFKSIFCRIRRQKMTSYSEIKHQVVNVSNNTLNLAAGSDLIKEIQEIIQNSNDLHFYIQILFTMTYLFDKRHDFIYIIDRLIENNKNTIFKLSKDYHKNSIHHHTNKHRTEIDVIYNLIKWISLKSPDSQQKKERFVNQSRKLVEYSQCFICKTTCLFQLKLIQAQRLMHKGQTQQSLDIFLRSFEMCLKYVEFNHEFSHVVAFLMRFMYHASSNLHRYNIYQFIYDMAKLSNDFSCYFSQLGEISVLINIYITISIEENPIEIANLMISILSFLSIRHSVQLINQFYYNLQLFFNTITDDQQKITFKQFHNIVISYILQDKQNAQLPLFAMYFCLLLLVKVKGHFDNILFRFITRSLNKIHSYSKYLILGRYFMLFSFYFDVSKRKMAFLSLQHYKYNIQQGFSLNNIIKIKTKSKKQYKLEKPFKYIKSAVKRYHQIIGNILVEGLNN